ncbi:RING finger protein 141-like isoform X2 [Dendronephthya gigantea]|uniref:RING finger protein 141-like isoform X2 n=1 Tax=Dendronephthya gigantea TaxID=151771 RepID=UPI00106D7124|nr:RING finger protein 141-like isoform X2 [Dendronephthya gigantea]
MGQKYVKTLQIVQENAVTLRDLTCLTYDGLIISSTDTSYLWKAFVQVTCCKIKKSTNAIETEKCLDLARFCRVYRALTKRYSKCESVEQSSFSTKVNLESQDLTISVILSSVDAVQAEPVEECCICMERHSDVSLACAHSYCKECIHQWFDEHKTCPICRKKVDGHEEFWVIADKPTESEMADYVMGFTDEDKHL